jgi:hypothetical protein
MYRDRDFDSSQLLSRREREYGRRYADQQSLELEQILPWNEDALQQDLGLEAVFSTMAAGDRFLFEVACVAVLSSATDPATIRYRQEIFTDCQKNAQTVRTMYALALEAIQSEKKNFWSLWSRYPGGILHRSVEVLQMFVGMLKKLRSMADEHEKQFRSEGFSRLWRMLKEELSDQYFATVQEHLRQLKFRRGVFISAELGVGNKGRNYVLRTPHQDTRNWMARLLTERVPSFTFQLHPRDETGAQALSALTDRGINLVANAVAQSTDHVLSFFVSE